MTLESSPHSCNRSVQTNIDLYWHNVGNGTINHNISYNNNRADDTDDKLVQVTVNRTTDLFDLEVLEDDIQTIKNNATRFVVVKKVVTEQRLLSGVEASRSHQNNEGTSTTLSAQIDKASLKFELDHKRGSLATVLNVMSDCKLNLTSSLFWIEINGHPKNNVLKGANGWP